MDDASTSLPMIGHLASPEVLLPDYNDANSPGFVPGIQYLATKYNMRKVRGTPLLEYFFYFLIKKIYK